MRRLEVFNINMESAHLLDGDNNLRGLTLSVPLIDLELWGAGSVIALAGLDWNVWPHRLPNSARQRPYYEFNMSGRIPSLPFPNDELLNPKRKLGS
jgi:hypothetical protein